MTDTTHDAIDGSPLSLPGPLGAIGPDRLLLGAVALISLAALAGALVGQYGMGLAPCALCLYQRVPFVLAAAIATAGLLPGMATARRRLTGLLVLVFATNAAIALYHVGVEQHWWVSAVCEPAATGAVGSDDVLAALQGQGEALPACDQVVWSLLGISMAGYNLILCTALALVAGLAAGRRRLWRTA